MGDPRKHRKKFSGPTHPWQKTRIEEEKALIKEYGLKNKQEIWKMGSRLTRFKDTAKRLIMAVGNQADIERQQLFAKLNKLGLLGPSDHHVDNVLGLTISNIMDRRLQSLVCKKGLARSVKQARQFITHEHIQINGKKITSPAYLVTVDEEPTISFVGKSALASEDHPERASPEKQKEQEKEKAAKKAAEEKKEEAKDTPKDQPKEEATEKTETKEEVKEATEEKKEDKKEEQPKEAKE